MARPTFDIRPSSARLTHVALRVRDLDSTISWYEDFTPLRVLDRRNDDAGRSAWLGDPDVLEHPFVLVVAQFLPEADPHPGVSTTTFDAFAHLGIELPTADDVDAIAARARAAGCLRMEPTQLPPPVGYICVATDPDGNAVEYSWDQGVYSTARARWGSPASPR